MPIVARARLGTLPPPSPPEVVPVAVRSVAALLGAPFAWPLREVLARTADVPAAAADSAASAFAIPPPVADWATGPLGEELASAHRLAYGAIGAAVVKDDAFVPVDALAWAARRVADLVAQVTAETKMRIRVVVTKGLSEGQSVDDVAAKVRDGLGLPSRWATAVTRYRDRLGADGVPAARRQDLVTSYRRRLIEARSQTIARTELLSATSAGRLAGFEAAQARGGLSGDVEKEWLTAGTSKRGRVVCPLCAPLDHVRVKGLDGEWLPGLVASPRHPSCRCSWVVHDLGGGP